jgi:HEPN domain-containing protein
MSAKKQDIISIAKDFAEEAYWDLQLAKRLFENLKLDTCMNNDEVFYIGRRILYFLQQASEKAIKAYFFTYFKLWVESTISITGQVDRNREHMIFDIQRKLIRLSQDLEPKAIGHKPHSTFLKVVNSIYEIFYKKKEYTIKYMQLFVDNLSQLLAQGIMSYLKEHFKKRNKTPLNTSDYEKKEARIRDSLKNFLSKIIIEPIEKSKLSESESKNIESICKKKKDNRLLPPCIDENALEHLKPIKEKYLGLEPTIEKHIEKEQLYEHVKKSNLDSFIAEIIDAIGIISENDIRKHIESYDKGKLKKLIDITSYFSFSIYLSEFLPKVYPCLALYETIGRYPDYEIDNIKKKEVICHDIEKIKPIKEEVEFLVNIVKGSVEAFKD